MCGFRREELLTVHKLRSGKEYERSCLAKILKIALSICIVTYVPVIVGGMRRRRIFVAMMKGAQLMLIWEELSP